MSSGASCVAAFTKRSDYVLIRPDNVTRLRERKIYIKKQTQTFSSSSTSCISFTQTGYSLEILVTKELWGKLE